MKDWAIRAGLSGGDSTGQFAMDRRLPGVSFPLLLTSVGCSQRVFSYVFISLD